MSAPGAKNVPRLPPTGPKLLLARLPVLTYSASLMIAGMLIAVSFLLLGVVVFTFLQKA
jgi:hypothetical protein